MQISRSVLAWLAGVILPSFLGTACLTSTSEQHISTHTQDLPDQHLEPRSKVKTALINVRVFDGHEAMDSGPVFFIGDRITADETYVVNTIDGEGGILLPGLIDSHCHPESNKDLAKLARIALCHGYWYPHLSFSGQLMLVEPSTAELDRYGVSTAMSMSCSNYTNCARLRNQVGRTSYFTAGYAAIGPDSAHAKAQGLSGDRVIHSVDQASEWVENVFGNGSNYLKITAELNGPNQVTQNALVAKAHEMGRKSMTHAAELEYYTQAITSKTDGPQHIPFDSVLNHSMLEQMVSQKQFATPTTILYKIVLPQMAKLDLNAGKVNITRAYNVVQENVRNMHAHGIPILAGTDSVAEYQSISIPFGVSLHDEIYDLVEIGMSPAEAIRAATATPARWHGLKDRGIIADGMRADLLLLQPDADPFTGNINDTRKIAKF